MIYSKRQLKMYLKPLLCNTTHSWVVRLDFIIDFIPMIFTIKTLPITSLSIHQRYSQSLSYHSCGHKPRRCRAKSKESTYRENRSN